MDALISIHPKYVNQICRRTKKFEFRKKIFKQKVEHILVYSTSPEKKISGYFKYNGFIYDTPMNIWEKCHKEGGINKDDFFKYFEHSEFAYAIIIDDFKEFSCDDLPKKINSKFTPPQSYFYINDINKFMNKYKLQII